MINILLTYYGLVVEEPTVGQQIHAGFLIFAGLSVFIGLGISFFSLILKALRFVK